MYSELESGLTHNIVAALVNLGEALGNWPSCSLSAERRKVLRLQTISATLALENHDVSTELIDSAIEVEPSESSVSEFLLARNHFTAYWRLSHWHPYNANHLLAAHHQLNGEYMPCAGQWRDGISESDVEDTLKEIEAKNFHPVIASCVAHYSLVKLRPFNRGNGGVARLWQTLILSRWRHEMTYAPYETVLNKNQQQYLGLLGLAGRSEGMIEFVEFMLAALVEACESVVDHPLVGSSSDNAGKLAGKTASIVLEQLSTDPYLTIPEVANRIGVTERTVERNVRKLKEAHLLARVGSAKGGHWRIVDSSHAHHSV